MIRVRDWHDLSAALRACDAFLERVHRGHTCPKDTACALCATCEDVSTAVVRLPQLLSVYAEEGVPCRS